jgi:hypothetical protein
MPKDVLRSEPVTASDATVLLDLGVGDRPALFRGSLVDACKFVWALPARDRAYLYVTCGCQTYTPAELKSMKHENYGET